MAARYAIVSALYAPHVGGVESFTERIAHELVREGDEVTVITSRLSETDPAHAVQDDGVEVWRLPCRPLMGGRMPVPLHNRAFRQLADQIARERFDGMLVNTRFYGMSIDGLRLARRCEAPAVVLDHGASWITLGNPLADAVLRVYERTMTARAKAYHPRFAGISKASVAWLGTFGIKTDTVIPNAIDAEAFRASSSGRDYRTELGISPEQKLVAFVGRLEPEKGPDMLAKALGELGEPYVGVLAGEGSLRPQIEALSLHNVHLMGNVSHQDVSALYAQADALCQPTRSEGFGLSILEAASWGVPIAMPAVGVAEEVLGSTYVRLDPPFTDLASKIEQTVALDASSTRESVERDWNWEASARALRAAFERA